MLGVHFVMSPIGEFDHFLDLSDLKQATYQSVNKQTNKQKTRWFLEDGAVSGVLGGCSH
ncbi:rCG44450, partial [Rattus norvegicus]